MLNENNDCDDSVVYCDGNDPGNDIYSVVTDANWSDGDEDITNLAAKLDAVDNASNLGLLILDGEDYYVERSDDEGTVHDNNNNFEIHKEENRQGNNDSRSLSIPDTLSLPSGLRSMLASGFTNVQAKQNMGESTGDNNIDPSQHAVRLQRFSKFKMMNSSVIMILISLTLLSLQSWRMRVWRNEALRMRNDFHKHQRNNYSLLPLTLSLAKERIALLEKQEQLEKIIERLKRRNTGTSSNYEDMLDQLDEDKILSIKTCYIEASLSLGRCSKDWQNWWWYDPSNDDSSGSSSEENDSNDDDYSFDTDLSMLAKSLTETLVATTVDSYSFVEKAVKDLSYAGIKDAFYTDNYTSGFSGQTAPDTEDIDNENSYGCAGGFQRVLSKLINGSEDAADEVTSKLSLWNW